MQTEPEVLIDHTDVIRFTSIERTITGRNTALAQIETLIQQLADISALTRSIRENGPRLGYDSGLPPGHLADRETTSRHKSHYPQF